MNKPVISIYMPAVRPQLWMGVYESLEQSNIPFELIAVGHVPPEYKLPDNFHFIKTKVKPVQCVEIGFRACKGEYCIYSHDDLFFGSNTLDLLLRKWLEINNELVVVSCMPYQYGEKLETNRYRFWDGVENSPHVPLAGLYKTSTMKKIGSRDKNFMVSYADLDIAMRLYEMGGYNVFCEGTRVNEDPGSDALNTQVRLINTGLALDWPWIEAYWVMDQPEYASLSLEEKNKLKIYFNNTSRAHGIALKHRKYPVEPFIETNLLKRSQGPKGVW